MKSILMLNRTGLPPTHLHTNWKGPMKVIKDLNSCYTQQTDFHVLDMKPFFLDFAVVDLLDIARRDYMEYFVDKILQHRGNPKKSSSM